MKNLTKFMIGLLALLILVPLASAGRSIHWEGVDINGTVDMLGDEIINISTINASGETIGMTGNVAITENITLSKKITFWAGQIIDGITNGWIRVTAGLRVTENVEITKGADIGETLNVTETVNADTLNATNLKAENLEQNLDGTGYNITAAYFVGEPLDGSIGSGILNSSNNKVHCGCINASDEGSLDVFYPDLVVRIWNYGDIVDCNIPSATVTVDDDTHDVYYVDSSCNIINVTWATYFAKDLNPANYVRIFDVFAQDGDIEVLKGSSVIGLANRKDKWNNINCGDAGHLSVCDGMDTQENTFPEINQTSGHFMYVNSVVTSQLRESGTQGLHIVSRVGGTWTHWNYSGINLTGCDDGTDYVQCTTNKFRRYILYDIGWGVNTKIHQLAPLDSESHNNVGDCIDIETNPLSYTLPTNEGGVAVVTSMLCIKRDDTAWTDGAWVDLRGGTAGFGATPDLSPFLTKDGTRPLTADWPAGDYNISSSGFIGSIWGPLANFTLGIFTTLTQDGNAVLDAGDEANLDVNSSLMSYDLECSDCLDDTEITLDVSNACGTNNVCGGGHTHPASEVTTGTFGAGDYVFPAELNMTGGDIIMNQTGTAYNMTGPDCIIFNNGFEICGS